MGKNYFSDRELNAIVPEGCSGINSERRTLLEILQNPFPEGYLQENILSDSKLPQSAKERILGWLDDYSQRKKFIGEDNDENLKEAGYGFMVAAPSASKCIEMLRELAQNSSDLTHRLASGSINAADIRNGITYPMFREALVEQLGVSHGVAARLIGRLDMTIHEGKDGVMQMVPRNLHEWWSHSGYVSRIVEEINSLL